MYHELHKVYEIKIKRTLKCTVMEIWKSFYLSNHFEEIIYIEWFQNDFRIILWFLHRMISMLSRVAGLNFFDLLTSKHGSHKIKNQYHQRYELSFNTCRGITVRGDVLPLKSQRIRACFCHFCVVKNSFTSDTKVTLVFLKRSKVRTKLFSKSGPVYS